MQHKYLFYQEKNRIKTYHFRDQNFELIRYRGNDSCPVDTENFWEWWERTSSYIPFQDQIDFCFLSDIDRINVVELFEETAESTWKLSEIEQFLQKHGPFRGVLLLQEGTEPISVNGQSTEDPIRLSVRTVPQTVLVKSAYSKTINKETITDTEVMENNDSVESVLSLYYREKTRSFT